MDSPRRPGEQIKLFPKQFNDFYKGNNFYVTLAYKNRVLIGQAFYLRKKLASGKYVTWIVQLVVSKKHRNQGIAKRIMQSIWGFSDDYAWGLFTPNINTIKVLESTTFRKCNPSVILKHIDEIKQISKEISFTKNCKFNVTNEVSNINTNFYVDRTLDPQKDYETEWLLGDLPAGHEWLAFTFQEQKIDIENYSKNFDRIISFSEEVLKDAYSRMRIKTQAWAQKHEDEVKYIINKTNLKENSDVIELGCGVGRHAFEFAQFNMNVVGIDFSQKHINNAKKNKKKQKIKNIKFYSSDIRTYKTNKQFDLVTCLYDVIGSFPDEKDNNAIIAKAYKLLKNGGYFVLSVMNFELTNKIVPDTQKGDLKKEPQILLKLKPSTEMMKTGNVFIPEYLAIDIDTNLIYRKEQFSSYGNNNLPAEYIIRDRRYTAHEIQSILAKYGFKIIEYKYVSAGNFANSLKPTEDKAKEILVVCQKV